MTNMKTNIKIYKNKTLIDRREELLNDIIKHDTYLPESILHDDLDKGMLNFIEENFKVISDGKTIPIIPKILTIQKWAEYKNTWEFTDEDRNIKLPFIAIIRKPDVQPGTNPITQRTIPNRKTFHYSIINTWNGVNKGANIYKIPQPVAVDITFDVSIVCNKFRSLNVFNKLIMQKFTSRQAYTTIKGHYIPIVLDSNSDSTPMELIDGRRFYVQNYQLTMLGYLIDADEFEVVPAINKLLVVNEFISEKRIKHNTINEIYGVDEISFNGDNTNKTYNLSKKITNLYYITKNNILLTKDTDYYHIAKTSKITFNEILTQNDNIKIYFNNGGLLDENGDKLNLNYETINYSTNEIILSNNIKLFLFLSINKNKKTIFNDFNIVNNNKILLNNSYQIGDIVEIIYLY